MASVKTLPSDHRRLVQSLETILVAANSVGEVPIERLRRDVSRVYRMLTGALVPHALAEDLVAFGDDPPATSPLTREHLEIGRLVDDLDALRSGLAEPPVTVAQEHALRRVLYGLYALLRAHLGDDGSCACQPVVRAASAPKARAARVRSQVQRTASGPPAEGPQAIAGRDRRAIP